MATSSSQVRAQESNSNESKKSFMEKLMTKIFCLYDEQSLIDVKFKVSNPACVIPAHRLILSAASPYFENLFNEEGDNNPVIEIDDDIDSDIFERLIVFCYTGKSLITVDNVNAMLKSAVVLQLEDVVTSCVDYLMSHINDYSLQEAYVLQRETQCELLKQKIFEYELQNFKEISQKEDFLNFDVEKLQCLIESDNLNISHEEVAFRAIARWFKYDVSARQEHVAPLIASLRLTQFNVDFLLAHLLSLPGCELLILKVLSWINMPAARAKINIRFPEPRCAENHVESTLLIIFKEGTSANKCVLQYNKAEDNWKKYANIDYCEKSRSILKEENIIFVDRKPNLERESNVFRSWNIRNKTWKDLPAMNRERAIHSIVSLDGIIYANGYSSNSNINSVERYTSNGWEFVADLNTVRNIAKAVTLNGQIYIMGGSKGNNLEFVESYNPHSDTWQSGRNISIFNCLQAAAHKGYIYVLFGDGSKKDLERYDPQQDTWTRCCYSECPTSFLISFDDKLWSLGRINTELCMSVYDEENKRWVMKNALPKGEIHSCLVVPVSLLETK